MLVGIFLRHFKIYSGARYIPFGTSQIENFNLFIGQNGAGKSSILEALDCFFNGSEFILNASEKKDEAFVAPVFLIKKADLDKYEKTVQKIIPFISDFLFDLKQSTSANYDVYANFFKQKDNLKKLREEYLLLTFSFYPFPEKEDLFFLTFDSVIKGHIRKSLDTLSDKDLKKALHKLKSDILKNYSYQYIPVETSLTDFLRLESKGMQDLMSENIKKRIELMLNSKLQIKKEADKSGFSNRTPLELLNSDLQEFVNDVESTIKVIDDKYSFDKEFKSKTNLTANHLTDIIIETYFNKRKLKVGKKPIDHLSAGERKKALIDIAYAFLKQDKTTNQNVILAIDEPEASLHISMCYGQFSRLHELAKFHNVQLLISTHWYGALPIIDEGNLYHIHDNNSKVEISEFSFNNYFQDNGSYPDDIHFKSFYDLVSSIVSSLRLHNKNWLIVESKDDKEYILKHLNKTVADNLIILPVGGCNIVLNLYNYLFAPLSQKSELKKIDKKVICLVDTDFQALKVSSVFQSETTSKSLLIRRLQVKDNEKIVLDTLENLNRSATEIEECLNPKAFYKALTNTIDKYGDEEIKSLFSNFLFDENSKNSFIKGDSSIIYLMSTSSLTGNPIHFKNQIAEFIDKNKKLICNEYCSLEITEHPSWISDLENLLT